ncbi:uncharacterized protein LOC123308001 [Coccinella septempunctata]|uniref:uncharacterized protein LOC123308001 n=1 Tax=Coccinella septempunctata TaxID=41139 RepID=UPI001D093EF9|nr:uncharacterized protein LOC123308001 [Coccinella septempunctata]
MKNYNEDHLLKIVKKIVKKQLSSDNVHITLGKGSEKLDGFMGEILTIHTVDQDTQKSLELIAKISLKDEKIRNYTAIAQSYKNEIQAYEEFFPALQEMRNDFKISQPIKSLVKFYHASETQNEEYIIMENIKMKGYEMLPVRHLLNNEEVKLIFESYGELHASSLALKALHPKKFQEITGQNVSVFRLILDMKISKDVAYSMTSIRDVMKEKCFEHVLLNKYTEDTIGILKKKMDFRGEKYVSFTHGDGWSNNIMFKYEVRNGQRSLSDIKLLDWQAWSVGPPVIDIMFCLFSSCSKEVFENLDTHIESYYESLTKTLMLYNLKAEEIYPFQEMQRQLEQHYHYPAIFGMMIRKIRSFDENHSIDPVNYSSNDDSTFFDAVRDIKFDKDYLFENLKYVFDFLDKKTNKNYDI